MRRTVFVVSLALALAMLCSNGAVVNAACPTVSCAAGGNLNDICLNSADGASPTTFVCTFVGTSSSGSVQTTVAYLTFDCSGGVSAYQAASNSNTGTFSKWGSPSGTYTYCLNSDDTGYIFSTTSGVCPVAIVLDAFESELRTLDTTPSLAQVGVCETQ